MVQLIDLYVFNECGMQKLRLWQSTNLIQHEPSKPGWDLLAKLCEVKKG
jgi:hypothetical protein